MEYSRCARGTLLVAAAAVANAVTGAAQGRIDLDESGIRAEWKTPAAISIPVRNWTGAAASGQLRLEWVDWKDRVRSAGAVAVAIAPGESQLHMALPLPVMKTNDQVHLRLRYRLSPMAGTRALATLAGTVALTEIAPQAFVLRLVRNVEVLPGTEYIVVAEAVHPAAGKLVPGAQLTAYLLAGETRILPARTNRDAPGSTVFTFAVPQNAAALKDLEVRATARLGEFHQDAAEAIWVRECATARIETDKTLYQPGQVLHMRALVRDVAGRAAAKEPVRVGLVDPNGELVREVRLTASAYGVVREDFELPDSGELGSYRVLVRPEKVDRALADATVRVSRYELPAFTVTAKADRSYHLPGQDATIDVVAGYLFGKPVSGAKVRVVRPRTSSGKASAETVFEGQAGVDGHLRALLPLGAEHRALLAHPAERYRDVTFEIYATDRESLRTERARFAVRVTREPIHIYITNDSEDGGSLPAAVYVSTWYADGSPAQTEAEVRLGGQRVKVRTNRLGIAKVMLKPERAVLRVEAVDAAGLRGQREEYVWSLDPHTLRVHAARRICRQGEGVALTIEAPVAELDLAVYAVLQGHTIDVRRVRVQGGVARLEFPYRPEFQRLVTFHAYSSDGSLGQAAVVFPDGGALGLTAAPERPEYRPGEKAAVAFTVSTEKGQAAQSVLGVRVVDQAVEERAKTDAEFGRAGWMGCAGCWDQPGGLALEALYHLDASQPIAEEMDLAAEALLARVPDRLETVVSESVDGADAYQRMIARQLAPVEEALNRSYDATLTYPRNAGSVARVLAESNIRLDELRDPWGTRYAVDAVTAGTADVLRFRSAGADKRFGTGDDFTAREIRRSFFRPYRVAIEEALRQWGGCARDLKEVREVLASRGVMLDTISDSWGTAYRARLEPNVWGARRMVGFASAGPDREFETPYHLDPDTAAEWLDLPCPVFAEKKIREALDRAVAFPASEQQFREQMAAAGVDPAKLVDPWGKPFGVKVELTDRTATGESGHPIRLRRPVGAAGGETLVQRQVVITLFSAGVPDDNGEPQPFDAARFEGVLDPVPLGATTGAGMLCGVVRSVPGTVASGVRLRLERAGTAPDPRYEVLTAAGGGYCFHGVAPGRYTLVAERRGHQAFEFEQIPVADGYTTEVDFWLKSPDGYVARASLIVGQHMTPRMSENAAYMAYKLPEMEDGSATGMPGGISTPRVREYFPETLLWVPELETDAAGRARLEFPLADNITNWRLVATASTVDGRVAEASADIRAFQPFFVDLNPPAVLTAGDRVALPVPVRNYLERAQNVSVEMAGNAWAEVTGPAQQELAVPAGESRSAVYPVVARNVVDAGKLRVTAVGGDSSDAIEKPVRVHPDGQENRHSVSDLVSGRTSLKLTIPAEALVGGTRGELRIYPSPLGMLRGAIEDMLVRPYGCAEQTTSAGMSNLVALRYARKAGVRNPAFEKQALRNLERTRDRLKGYRARGGGFSYWGDGAADLAVTAYALEFLTGASEFVAVDAPLVRETAEWLAKQRGADKLWGAGSERGWSTAAVVVRGLAAARRRDAKLELPPVAAVYQAYMARAGQASPYVVARLAMAAMDAGETVTAARAVRSLEGSVRRESGGVKWDGAVDTAFGGWGRAAAVESTAAAVAALARWRETHPAETALAPLVRQGTLYLLRNRDRYGVWYSTQGTVAVMEAVAAASGVIGAGGKEGGKLGIVVNGVALPDAVVVAGDGLRLDLAGRLRAGANEIELIPAAGAGSMVATVLETHWMPWEAAAKRSAEGLSPRVAFDRTVARAGERVEAVVEARRGQGFGMLLAEVGLPPGADVDRDALERQMRDAASRLCRYDVLPDRVILYLWPELAGASKVTVGFRARYAMDAKAAASVLWDYYNPDAMVEVAPVRFRVE